MIIRRALRFRILMLSLVVVFGATLVCTPVYETCVDPISVGLPSQASYSLLLLTWAVYYAIFLGERALIGTMLNFSLYKKIHLFLILCIALYFRVDRFILFYLAFEVSLVPIFIIILG